MFKYIKGKFVYIVLVSIIAVFSGCSDIDNTGSNTVGSAGGQFVSASVIDDINDSVMLLYVQGGIDATATNAFGYKAVKITYNTVGQNDEAVVASGLLVIPTVSDAYLAYLDSVGKSFSVSMICDNHGTIFTDAEAPTNVEVAGGAPEYTQAILMTGFAGFASILPDYIGYGDSNDVSHPYMLKKASARASLDMIKASIKYMNDTGVLLNYQLFVSGYSQGGYTAMALAEEIEKSYSEVSLKGVAPMAGPHDLEALGDIEIDASHLMQYPAFLGYLADSYSYYNDDINLADFVVETDTTLFHSLFDGSNTNVEIHASLFGVDAQGGMKTYTADSLFTSALITDYASDSNIGITLKNKFRANATYDWTPKTKVNLVHCIDDEIVPASMSQIAYDTFIANGVSSSELTLTSIPTAALSQQIDATHPFVHANCGTEAYGTAVSWFADIRSGVIQ